MSEKRSIPQEFMPGQCVYCGEPVSLLMPGAAMYFTLDGKFVVCSCKKHKELIVEMDKRGELVKSPS